jgi:gamma-glutamylcyclotransferase (GGCT)/AIG2-like uncharacterized protein YtfP
MSSSFFFVYGTLLEDQLLFSLIRPYKYVSKVPAILKDFKRFQIKNEVYPGVMKRRGEKVLGMLLEFKEAEVEAVGKLLDQYEGDEYMREIVIVNESIEAFVYIYIGDKAEDI